MEYQVLSNDSAYELQAQVRIAIGEGWKPLGGVACGGGGAYNEINIYYAQAMVKD